MVLYQTFHHLGMHVEVLPLFDTTPLDAADEALFEMEAKICRDDPENHMAIDFDHWQCTKCHEGYPTLEEYREGMKNREDQISRVGKELYSFQIGENKDKGYRLHVRGGIDYREWQRELVDEVCISALCGSLEVHLANIYHTGTSERLALGGVQECSLVESTSWRERRKPRSGTLEFH
jgi:hypothetical protein